MGLCCWSLKQSQQALAAINCVLETHPGLPVILVTAIGRNKGRHVLACWCHTRHGSMAALGPFHDRHPLPLAGQLACKTHLGPLKPLPAKPAAGWRGQVYQGL